MDYIQQDHIGSASAHEPDCQARTYMRVIEATPYFLSHQPASLRPFGQQLISVMYAIRFLHRAIPEVPIMADITCFTHDAEEEQTH